jgi:XTP/dITP diphosphohydrolase
MKIIFATNNKHKLAEIRSAASAGFEIAGLEEMGIYENIPETQETLEGNAIQKARFIADKYGFDCFADDTGLEVEALDNRPGVYSARYAGEGCSFNDNVKKLLLEMQDKENRQACFRTIIAFSQSGKVHTFEGIVRGLITNYTAGTEGFGYDPVFMPEGHDLTFAQMPPHQKNKISHRAKALEKFLGFLKMNSVF